MIARQVFYEGRVQGVGFRYTVKQIAKGYEIVGTIKNLPDGRVELQAGGESDEVSQFLSAIRQSELGSHIIAAHEHDIEPLKEFNGFKIQT